MIELQKITPASADALWQRVESLYLTAFPPEERRSVERMRALAASGRLCVAVALLGDCDTRTDKGANANTVAENNVTSIAIAPDDTDSARMAEQRFCGFITWWDFGSFVYGEHLAILPECRCGGVGGRVIDALTAVAQGRMTVIEVELPTGDLERRRIGFYRRHGFEVADFPYIQPPYEAGYAGVPMHIMTHGGRLTAEQFERVRNRIYTDVYGVATVG